jgi:hypothetical protein
MTDTRRKARAMLNDARDAHVNPDDYLVGYTALCRAIEQHEAFRKEVSDVVEQALSFGDVESLRRKGVLSRFIIPKPKPDPLVDALTKAGWGMPERNAKELRAALGAVGFEIREKNDDQ